MRLILMEIMGADFDNHIFREIIESNFDNKIMFYCGNLWVEFDHVILCVKLLSPTSCESGSEPEI